MAGTFEQTKSVDKATIDADLKGQIVDLQKKNEGGALSKEAYDDAVKKAVERLQHYYEALGGDQKEIEENINKFKAEIGFESSFLEKGERQKEQKDALINSTNDKLTKLYDSILSPEKGLTPKQFRFEEARKYADYRSKPGSKSGIEDYDNDKWIFGSETNGEIHQYVRGFLSAMFLYGKPKAENYWQQFKKAEQEDKWGVDNMLDKDNIEKICNFKDYEAIMEGIDDYEAKAYIIGLLEGARQISTPDFFVKYQAYVVDQIKKGDFPSKWDSDPKNSKFAEIKTARELEGQSKLLSKKFVDFKEKVETWSKESGKEIDDSQIKYVMATQPDSITLDPIYETQLKVAEDKFAAIQNPPAKPAEKGKAALVAPAMTAAPTPTSKASVEKPAGSASEAPAKAPTQPEYKPDDLKETYGENWDKGYDVTEFAFKDKAGKELTVGDWFKGTGAKLYKEGGADPKITVAKGEKITVAATPTARRVPRKNGERVAWETFIKVQYNGADYYFVAEDLVKDEDGKRAHEGAKAERTSTNFEKSWAGAENISDYFFKGKEKIKVRSDLKKYPARLRDAESGKVVQKAEKGTELSLVADASAKKIGKDIFIPVQFEGKTLYIHQRIVEDLEGKRAPEVADVPTTETPTTTPTATPASAPGAAPAVPTAATPEGHEVPADPTERNWANGEPIYNHPFAGYNGDLVIKQGFGDIPLRNNQGRLTDVAVAPGTHMKLMDSAGAARKVENFLFINVDYADHSYFIPVEYLAKMEGEKQKGPEGAFVSPEIATAEFEKNHPSLKPVNPNYLYQLSAIDAYADKPDGARFDLLFNGYMLAFRAFRMPDGKYKISYNGGEIEEPYNSKEDVLRAVNDGSALQKVMLKVLGAKYQFEQHEKVTGTVRNVEKTEKTPPYDYTVELDWNNPNAKVDVRALPFGRIGYRVNRENVAYDGGSMREGVAESLPEFALKMKHIRAWAEGDQHFKTIDTASQHEILFDTITNSYNYNNERAAIGRIVSFKIDKNDKVEQVVNLALDWGNFGPTQLMVWLENNQLHYFMNGRKAQTGGISGNFAQMIESVKKIREAA